MATIRRNCPHCATERVAFDVIYSAPKTQTQGYVWNCFAVCGYCREPVCFVATGIGANVNQPTAFGEDIQPYFQIGPVWPETAAASAPAHTPPSVAKRFLEGEDAFRRRNWNSAVAMYRSALDIATKGMPDVPQKKPFFDRLIWLHEKHAITPDIKDWADHVRVEGNAALHDPEDFDENDAKALRFFTEMFLRYVFEMPGAVRDFRREPDPAPQ